MLENKQIIIDGIDVSGCIHRATNKIGNDIGTYCRCFTESCKNIKNCHYKQLKRAEQECERLKRQYNCYACDTCNGKEDYINLKRHCKNAIKSLHNKQAEFDQLKSENEKLKKIINEAKNSKLDLKSFLVAEAVQNEYEQQLDQLKAENEELKKIIERLNVPKHEVIDMDIALKNEKLKQTLTEIKEIVCRLLIGGVRQEILQKISEVEDGNI